MIDLNGMSSDGSRIAIGAIANEQNGDRSGHVRVLYDCMADEWEQVSGNIDGETENSQSGYAVAMSSDGSRIAIGAPQCMGRGG